MKKLIVPLVILTPVAVLALLGVMIARSLDKGIEKMQPVGAGAGETGGANALGQALSRNDEHELRPASIAQQGEGDEQATAISPALSETGETIDPAMHEAGVLLVVRDDSGKSSASSPIYLAGNVNNWNPKDPAFVLSPQSDMRWRILLKMPRSIANASEPVAFKFTRGDWALEELNADLTVPGNRTLPRVPKASVKADEPIQIELNISAWGDMRPEFAERAGTDPYRSIKATGTLRRLQVAGGVSNGIPRDVLVWLPPGYEQGAAQGVRYPVLYLHDGQNVFEKLPHVPGEWQADETALQLIERGMAAPAIIVGVPHGGALRTQEYLPGGVTLALRGRDPVVGRGDEHLAWLTGEVMPRVERAFSVSTDPELTAIGGASLGAVISLEAVRKHPGRFGKILLESTASMAIESAAWDSMLNDIKAWPGRAFIAVGGREMGDEADKQAWNEAYVRAAKDLDARFEKGGIKKFNRLLMIEQEATHTESAWAARFDDAYRFLFPPVVSDGK